MVRSDSALPSLVVEMGYRQTIVTTMSLQIDFSLVLYSQQLDRLSYWQRYLSNLCFLCRNESVVSTLV